MKRKVLELILVGFVVLLIGGGSSFAAEPGVTKDTIKIGMFCPLSGPFQSYGIEPWRGATMWYDKVNKDGGIHGRKLKIISEDDKCTGTDLVAAVKKLVTMDEVFVLNGGSCSSALVSGQEYIERVKVPTISLDASGDQCIYPPSKYIFAGLGITQHAVGGSMIDFVTKHLKAKRISWICHSDAYGNWNIEAAEYQLKKEHPDVILNIERVEREATDTTAIALKVKNANPDVVCLVVYDRPAALLIKSLYDLGVKSYIVLAANAATNLVNTSKAVGIKEAFKNLYYQDCNFYDSDNRPGPQWARKMYAQYYPDLAKLPEHPNAWMFTGITSAQIVCKGLEGAGPEPTREKFLKAVENITHFDSGLMSGPVEFSATDHAAVEAAVYLKFDGEKATLIPGSFPSLWRWGVK
jgi:branched-chain amino acid transport system substrate-binding protein